MIPNALTYIRDVLNKEFRNEFSTSEDLVVLSNLINPDGSIPEGIMNKLVLFPIVIGEEATLKSVRSLTNVAEQDKFTRSAPPIHLNIHILVCANFEEDKYMEGLSFLSFIINCFRERSVFTSQDDPKVNGKISLEFRTSSIEEMNHLWSAIGVKLMPSLHYKVRTIEFDQGQVKKEIPSINSLDNQKDEDK